MILSTGKIISAGGKVYQSVSTPPVIPVDSWVRITTPATTIDGLVFTPANSTVTATANLQNALSKYREGFVTGVKDISFKSEIKGIPVAFENPALGYQNTSYLGIGYNPGNGKVEAIVNGNYYTLVQDFYTANQIPVMFAYRSQTKDFIFMYSPDGGATWTQGQSGAIAVPDNLTLLLRVNYFSIDSGSFEANMMQKGMTVYLNVS